MPKEVFKSSLAGDLSVGWWSSEKIENGKATGEEYIGPWVDFSIGGLGKFQFGDDNLEFDRLYMQINDPEEIDRLIKTLERIKRKVFSTDDLTTQ